MKYEDQIKDEAVQIEEKEAEAKPTKKAKSADEEVERKPRKNSKEYDATVNCDILNVRDTPDGNKIAQLTRGTDVHVVDEDGEWAKIVGYVNKSYIG